MFYSSSYQYLSSDTEVVKTFGGYCHNDVIQNGQWYEMTNMSGAKYPAISTRPKRGRSGNEGRVAICDKDGLVEIYSDGSLHAGGYSIPNFVGKNEKDLQLVSMGGYLIVFPNKVWANVTKLKLGSPMVEGKDYGSLEAYWEQTDDAPGSSISEPNAVWMHPCQEDGSLWDYIPAGFKKVEVLPVNADEAEHRRYILTSTYPYERYIGRDKRWAFDGYHYGYIVSDTKPDLPDDGCLWMNTAVNPPVLQKWMATTKMWTIMTCYVRMTGKFDGIDVGDAVTLTMPQVLFSEQTEDLGTAVDPYAYYANPYSELETVLGATAPVEIENLSVINGGKDWLALKLQNKLAAPVKLGSVHRQLVNSLMVAWANQGSTEVGKTEASLWAMTNDELRSEQASITNSTYGFGYTGQAPLTLARTIPDMDYVTEAGNRLWGCFYGQDKDGNILNEIYASKLGDFKNWRCYQGLSTDSYAASRGSDGKWTGAISLNNYPLFFKKNCMEKIYISASGAHQIATTKMPGVQAGSWKSMQIIDGVLYYLSDSGVMSYDGSLPDCVSADLGDVRYAEGVAGSLGNKYYLSAKRPDGACELFVFDKTKYFWHREDSLRVTCMADTGDALYMADQDGALWAVGNYGDMAQEEPFNWELVSGAIGYSLTEQEYLKRMDIRMKLEPGSVVAASVMYDDDGTWHAVGGMEGEPEGGNAVTKTADIPIRPRRCDHFRIKLEGDGDVTIYSIAREIERGSVLVKGAYKA